jgi:AbiV family abortive infection protein
VDLKAIKSASRPDLAACAIAAAANAQGLLQDAELLAGSGRMARAYSLAVLAVEECGKAMDLTALALMPESLRAQAPVGRMLEWHQLKLVGGLLMAVVPLTNVTSKLADMPTAELAQTLSILDEPADEADRLKRRGFYVDMDRSGRRIRRRTGHRAHRGQGGPNPPGSRRGDPPGSRDIPGAPGLSGLAQLIRALRPTRGSRQALRVLLARCSRALCRWSQAARCSNDRS